jgi:hypothetical protein
MITKHDLRVLRSDCEERVRNDEFGYNNNRGIHEKSGALLLYSHSDKLKMPCE